MIKVLKKSRIVDERQVAHARDERRMLLAVNHPLIIKLWGTFQDYTNLYMVMEYVPGGELYALLERVQASDYRNTELQIRKLKSPSPLVPEIPGASEQVLCR